MKIGIVVFSMSKNRWILEQTMARWINFAREANLAIFYACDGQSEDPLFSGSEQIQFTLSSWNDEWLQILNSDKLSMFSHIFVVLDDFLLLKYDLIMFQAQILSKPDFDYLSIEGHPDITALFGTSERAMPDNRCLLNIPSEAKFKNSLKPSIWKREYLINSLESHSSIWSLEDPCLVTGNYLSVFKPALHVVHVLEKGKPNFNYLVQYIVGRLDVFDFRHGFAFELINPRRLISYTLLKLFGTSLSRKLDEFLGRNTRL